MTQETQAQQLARNAANRIARAMANTSAQKMLDLQSEDLMRRIESGEQRVIPEDEYQRLKALDTGDDDPSPGQHDSADDTPEG